jgi:hypothetical protein
MLSSESYSEPELQPRDCLMKVGMPYLTYKGIKRTRTMVV